MASTMLKKLRELNVPKAVPMRKKSKKLADLHIHKPYVIVGGGVAAGYACTKFVDADDYEKDSVIVISKEPVAPYERPALTKSYLHSPESASRIRLPAFYTCAGSGGRLQTEQWYSDNGIDLYLSHEAVSIDAKNKTIVCQNLLEEHRIIIKYDKLILATGSRPLFTDVFPPESILKNIFVLRNEADGAALIKAMEKKRRGHVLIVGGGYLGLECAAAFAGWEYAVTIVTPEDRVLKRFFTPEISKWYEEYFTRIKNIQIIKNKEVQSFTGTKKAPTTLKYAVLEDGTQYEVDVVVIGIGAVLNTEMVQGQVKFASGAIRGVQVNEYLQTSNSDIYAVGDIAAFPQADGNLRRFEHVDHARRSAEVAVQNILNGNQTEYHYFPFIYSRVFEYTKNPVIFNFYGTKGDDSASCVHFGDFKTISRSTQTFGAFYVDADSVIIGGILVNGNKKNFKELREIVSSGRKLDVMTPVGAQAMFKTLVVATPLSKPPRSKPKVEKLESVEETEEVLSKIPVVKESFFLAAAQAYQNIKPVSQDSTKTTEESKPFTEYHDYEEPTKKEEEKEEDQSFTEYHDWVEPPVNKFTEYKVGPASYAVVQPGRCILNEEWVPYPLVGKMQISDNSFIFTFLIPQNRFMQERRLNLSTSACILALPSGGEVITDEDYNYVEYKPPICPLDNEPFPPRPYTPVSTNAMIGKFELLIKIYPNGRFTQHLNTLVPGKSTVMFKHVQGNVKIQYPFGNKEKIGFIVGGTGVNPIIQMLHAILGNKEDETPVSMLYGNHTQIDILGKQILDSWKDMYPQFSLEHILSKEAGHSDWNGLRGRIDGAVVKANASFPKPQEDCTIFVCGPDGMYESACGARGKGGFCTAADFTGFLKDLGYKPAQVYKY